MKNKYFDINDSGCSVRCKLYYNEGAAVNKAVIFGHGFGGHKDNKAAEKFADKLLSKQKGSVVICFDWPCHGKDSYPKLSAQICDAYISMVLSYIGNTYPGAEVMAYATSFGGYLLLKYLHDHNENPFKKIALRCPAIAMYESLTNKIMDAGSASLLAKGKDVLIGFDRKIKISQSFIDDIEAADIRKNDYLDFADDILIIHGTKDEIVPFPISQEFCENNVIEFLPVENADHRFSDPQKMDLAIAEIIRFFS